MQPPARRLLVLLLLCGGFGCEPYRIEYRDRPAFLPADQQPPDRVELPDGTIIVYRDRGTLSGLEEKSRGQGEGSRFQIREEREDGTVVLRSLLPEHVLANTHSCLQNQEYELVWDQLLSEQTRAAYEGKQLSRDEFIEFFRKHRVDLAKTVYRMYHGIPRHEVVSDTLGGGRVRLRFIPEVGKHFKFRSVIVASERDGLKLEVIR